jgi:hypothetical protein
MLQLTIPDMSRTADVSQPSILGWNPYVLENVSENAEKEKVRNVS